MRRFLRLAGAGALACGLLGATEAIAVLSSSGLCYESPTLEILAQVLRYGSLGALFGILFGRIHPELPIANAGRWTFALGLFVMGGWWVHSALLQNIGLLEPISLVWSAGILTIVLAVFFLTNKVKDAHLPKGTLALVLLSPVLLVLAFLFAWSLHLYMHLYRGERYKQIVREFEDEDAASHRRGTVAVLCYSVFSPVACFGLGMVVASMRS